MRTDQSSVSNATDGTSSSTGSGNNHSNSDNQDDGQSDQPKTVSYESYHKLLGQRKADQAKLREYETRLKEIDQAKAEEESKRLEEQGQYKTLLENERKKSEDLESRLKTRDVEDQRRKKLAACIDGLEGKVPQKYWHLFELDSIVIDPTTGNVDGTSVANELKRFNQDYPEVIAGPKPQSVPNHAPGGGAKLTYDEWLKLPAKEMAKRRLEIMRN